MCKGLGVDKACMCYFLMTGPSATAHCSLGATAVANLMLKVQSGRAKCGFNCEAVTGNRIDLWPRFTLTRIIHQNVSLQQDPKSLYVAFNVMPYHAMPNYTTPYIPYHAIPCHTIPYHTISYHTTPHHAMPCHAEQFPHWGSIMYSEYGSNAKPYYVMSCHAIPCHAMPYHAISPWG